MEINYYVSVTDLDGYAYYRQAEFSTTDYVTRLLRMEPPTSAMEFGTKLHEQLEDILIRKKPIPPNSPFSTMELSLPRPDATEVPVTDVFLRYGEAARLSGRIDAVRGETLTDYKTTGRTINLDRYAEAMQWRAYLMLYPSAQHFRYEVFRIKNQTVEEHRSLSLNTYPGLRADVIDALWGYVDHMKTLAEADYIRMIRGRPVPGPRYLEQFEKDFLENVAKEKVKSSRLHTRLVAEAIRVHLEHGG